MTHQPEKKGFDLFNKISRTEYSGVNSGIIPHLRDVNLLHFGSALLQIGIGSFALTLSYLQLIQSGWAAVVMTVLGSASIISGFAMVYISLKNQRPSVDKLVQETIQRVIRDHN